MSAEWPKILHSWKWIPTIKFFWSLIESGAYLWTVLMKISFSISKNNQVYKLNMKHQCLPHPLHLYEGAVGDQRLLQIRSWSSSASKVHLHNEKQSLANIFYHDLVKKKGKLKCLF